MVGVDLPKPKASRARQQFIQYENMEGTWYQPGFELSHKFEEIRTKLAIWGNNERFGEVLDFQHGVVPRKGHLWESYRVVTNHNFIEAIHSPELILGEQDGADGSPDATSKLRAFRILDRPCSNPRSIRLNRHGVDPEDVLRTGLARQMILSLIASRMAYSLAINHQVCCILGNSERYIRAMWTAVCRGENRVYSWCPSCVGRDARLCPPKACSAVIRQGSKGPLQLDEIALVKHVTSVLHAEVNDPRLNRIILEREYGLLIKNSWTNSTGAVPIPSEGFQNAQNNGNQLKHEAKFLAYKQAWLNNYPCQLVVQLPGHSVRLCYCESVKYKSRMLESTHPDHVLRVSQLEKIAYGKKTRRFYVAWAFTVLTVAGLGLILSAVVCDGPMRAWIRGLESNVMETTGILVLLFYTMLEIIRQWGVKNVQIDYKAVFSGHIPYTDDLEAGLGKITRGSNLRCLMLRSRTEEIFADEGVCAFAAEPRGTLLLQHKITVKDVMHAGAIVTRTTLFYPGQDGIYAYKITSDMSGRLHVTRQCAQGLIAHLLADKDTVVGSADRASALRRIEV